MTQYLSLESQISSVMESLARAAVDEICKLVDTECVEMRLEIHRSQSEIESLKKQIRDLKKEFRHDSPASGSLHADHSHVDEDEREIRSGRLHQGADCSAEEDEKFDITGVTDNLEGNQGNCSCLLSFGNELCLLHKKVLQCSESQILSDSKDKADEGLDSIALKVECGSYSVPTTEGVSDIYQGGSKNQFGTTEDFQPQTQHSEKCHHQPSEETSHCMHDRQLSPLYEWWKSEGSQSGVEFKTEQEEVPLVERTNKTTPCGIVNTNVISCPSLPTLNFESCVRGRDCSLGLQQSLLVSHTEAQVFHHNTTEPRIRQARAQKNWDRIHQTRTFKQNSANLSVMLSKVNSLPIPDHSYKPFSCSFCPKSFLSATDLKRHHRIHTGEKPYSCGVCGKRFSLRGNLITHERVHSGSKPFICQYCGRGFTQRTNRDVHQRIHTGEKPYSCSVCGKCFTHRRSVMNHQKVHTSS